MRTMLSWPKIHWRYSTIPNITILYYNISRKGMFICFGVKVKRFMVIWNLHCGMWDGTSLLVCRILQWVVRLARGDMYVRDTLPDVTFHRSKIPVQNGFEVNGPRLLETRCTRLRNLWIPWFLWLPAGEADKTKKKAETLLRHFIEPVLIRHSGGRIVPVLGTYNACSQLGLSELLHGHDHKSQSQYQKKLRGCKRRTRSSSGSLFLPKFLNDGIIDFLSNTETR